MPMSGCRTLALALVWLGAWCRNPDALPFAQRPWARDGPGYGALSGARAGEACRAAGQVPKAAAALREAVNIGEHLGAAPLVEEALTVARKTHLRLVSEVPPPVSALGLTRREIDVLCLVADGSSNSVIAQTLFISPKTVSVHVSNILASWR